MSTRSMILMEQENGEYIGVYCHCDGYLTHNGALLIDHYNDRDKVKELIGLGDLSYLAPRIIPYPDRTHSFDKPQRGVCIFYGRDRGETSTEATKVTLEELDSDPWIEYTYVYGLDDKWKYYEYRGLEKGMKSLDEDLNSIFEEWGFTRPKGIYGWYTKSDIERLKSQSVEQEEKENEIEINSANRR
jgi:hypothetical protein